MAAKTPTVGEYLISRLHALGAGHVFGIPGDYVLGFYDLLASSPLKTIVTADEQGAGFAADAYARLRGLGVVCVTYCVGGLKVANTTAEAFAEKSPVVIISGAPGMKEREKNPLLHHKVRDFETQKRVFEHITVASTVLSDPQTAFQEIDRVLHTALRYKRPVYIELPRDIVFQRGNPLYQRREIHETSDPVILRTALAEAVSRINAAHKPVILADVEVHRFGLQRELLALARRSNIPVAATILGKSVVSELHPFYLGVYEGAMGRENVRRYVESSDCVIMLGVFMTDINLGVYTAQLDLGRCINITSEKLSIGHHNYEDVRFKDFVRGLVKAKLRRRTAPKFKNPKPAPFRATTSSRPLTIRAVIRQLNSFIDKNTVVVTDTGDSLFGAADLTIHRGTEFLATAYYASMGFAIPGAVGAQLAKPGRRPIVLVGDGAFHMTGLELATVARNNLNPIVIVLNNSGYGTERHIHEGPFNDLWPLRFHRVTELIGAGRGWLVETEGQFYKALLEARRHRQSFCLIEVKLDKLDCSPALARLAKRLSERVVSSRRRQK
ncbi:MAG: alpha-keto acid decarboxylase family protein [Pedosphaera sp.]|nr:alpha-keto acid decarboxylase family protein [Pedosphaera sp.]